MISHDTRSARVPVMLLSALSLALLSLNGCEDMGPGSSPSFGDQTVDDLHFPVGIPVGALKLPAATGGNGTLTYRWTHDVPGLRLDPIKHTVSGTPRLRAGVSSYRYGMRYTATDADGDSAELKLWVTVFKPVPVRMGSPVTKWISRTGRSYFEVIVDRQGTLIAATDIAQEDRADTVVRILGVPDYRSKDDSFDNHIDGVKVGRGTYYINVEIALGGAHGSYTLATWLMGTGDSSFDIDLRYEESEWTASEKAALHNAAAFWERAITGDLSDVPILASDRTCGEDVDPLPFGTQVDDVVIHVTPDIIDGIDGTLARAGPCWGRAGLPGAAAGLPFIGLIVFDVDDLGRLQAVGALQSTIIHEMAHALGFGVLWDDFRLLKNPSVDSSTTPPSVVTEKVDTHFTGLRATLEFTSAAIGGRSYAGAKVPVENDISPDGFGVGGLDVHWRESVFGTEAMTPRLDTGANPVSRVTLASLADLGYKVDYSVADDYTLPPSGRAGLQGRPRHTVDLHDDIWRGPVRVEDFVVRGR